MTMMCLIKKGNILCFNIHNTIVTSKYRVDFKTVLVNTYHTLDILKKINDRWVEIDLHAKTLNVYGFCKKMQGNTFLHKCINRIYFNISKQTQK